MLRNSSLCAEHMLLDKQLNPLNIRRAYKARALLHAGQCQVRRLTWHFIVFFVQLGLWTFPAQA